MNLKGSVVLITGSSIGIGRETAFKFASEGCKVVVTYYKDEKEAAKVAEKCLKLGAPDAFVLQLNVTDDNSIQKCVKAVVKKYGHISILVNNAGVIAWKPFAKQTFKEIMWQVDVNLAGLMKMTREALPHVKDLIINIASGAGKTAYADLVPYCATKFGVRGFTQGLAQEIKIPVIAINPGTTATRMTGFKGVPPEKVAGVIIDAAKGKIRVGSGGDVDIWEHV